MKSYTGDSRSAPETHAGGIYEDVGLSWIEGPRGPAWVAGGGERLEARDVLRVRSATGWVVRGFRRSDRAGDHAEGCEGVVSSWRRGRQR